MVDLMSHDNIYTKNGDVQRSSVHIKLAKYRLQNDLHNRYLLHRIYAPNRDKQWVAFEDLVWKKLRDPSQDKLRIANNQGEAQQIQYSDVLKLLGHGQYLEKLEEPSKDDSTYRITDIPNIRDMERNQSAKIRKPITLRMAGRSKGLHLNSTLGVPSYRDVLSASSNHINDGCRVEMYVEVAKSERRKMRFDLMMAKNPHLRPETVLKSMPEGTKMTYEPLFDTVREQLVWVMDDERKWPRGRKHVGWTASANSPPNDYALKVLRELPVVRSMPAQSLSSVILARTRFVPARRSKINRSPIGSAHVRCH
ncbi:MAG: hypothetical protein Q9210_002198 [Variospora velana]